MNQKIAVRVFTEKIDKKEKINWEPEPVTYKGIFVFDCETTIDHTQNLTFGSYQYWESGVIQDVGLFYNPQTVNEVELNYLKESSHKKLIKLVTREEFVKILVDYVLTKKALCVGHNLVFDVSRLAIGVGEGRKSYKGNFSFKLSEDRSIPRIKTKRISENKILLRFGGTIYGAVHGGNFVDTQILASAILDTKKISLNELAKRLNISEKKVKVEKHGKITPEYIDYNLQDTRLTYLVFQALELKFKEFELALPITKAISGASIGKEFLRKMKITPFLNQVPNFPKKLLGNCMSAYFGGRCEVKFRKKPVPATVLDFSSMYPTIHTLLNLQKFVISKDIRPIDATKSIQELLNKITPEDLLKKENWAELCVLCKIKPNSDCLPVRSDYGGKSLNVGLNYFTSDDSFYYFLPDLILSKFLAGKTPIIEEGIQFVSVDCQDSLNSINLFGIEFDPRKQDFIHELVIQRNNLKEKNPSQAQGMKIIANSTAYGIFIELNPEKKPSNLKVYSRDTFETIGKHEEVGEYFNPIIGGLIVSGARLLLGLVEVELKRMSKMHYACDTDSMFVPPEVAERLQEKFQVLSPYQTSIYLLKKQYTNVLFYGVSSKRYVLYKQASKRFDILDYKLHGLGYILNPFGAKDDWQKAFWEDGLKLNYGLLSEQDIIDKYSGYYSLSQLTVSNWGVYQRFRNFNDEKSFLQQIKPFNFMILGFGKSKEIKPLAPYTKKYQEVVHNPFLDYKTGKILEGLHYWQNLSDVFIDFFNHPEYKLEGKIGVLERKFIHSSTCLYIGKESQNIEQQIIEKQSVNNFVNREELTKILKRMSRKDAKKIGLPKSTFYRLRSKFALLRSKTLRRLNYS